MDTLHQLAFATTAHAVPAAFLWLVGQNGEISHTAQRAIAHHSLPGLATLGHLHQWNGTAIHGTTLKTRGGPANRWGLKQVQQDGMCLWSA